MEERWKMGAQSLKRLGSEVDAGARMESACQMTNLKMSLEVISQNDFVSDSSRTRGSTSET